MEIDDIVWQDNCRRAIEALQALENDDVDSYTRRMEISDYRA